MHELTPARERATFIFNGKGLGERFPGDYLESFKITRLFSGHTLYKQSMNVERYGRDCRVRSSGNGGSLPSGLIMESWGGRARWRQGREDSDGSIGHGWYEYTHGTQSERLRGKRAIKRIEI